MDYGQRHRIELEQAKRIANLANVPYQIVSLDILSQLNPNALVCSDMDIRSSMKMSCRIHLYRVEMHCF